MRILFDLLAFTALFFMLRYRVHIHIEYEPRQRSRRNPRRKSSIPTLETATDPGSVQMLADLKSALVNLGAEKAEAERMARAAIAQGPADFEALILRAMQSREPGKRIRI